MYAVKNPGDVYHLLQVDRAFTLCGLKVHKLQTTNQPTSSLNVSTDKPAGRLLCQHCSRMAEDSEM